MAKTTTAVKTVKVVKDTKKAAAPKTTRAPKAAPKEKMPFSFQMFSIKLVKEETVSYEGAKKKITSPRDAFAIVEGALAELDREHMIVLILNTKNEVTAINTVSVGSLNAAVVHPREVFKAAILGNANSIILAHNHPSSDSTPSQEDIQLTKRIVEAGEVMGIQVLDHIIVGTPCLSMKEQGLM